ncbi:MAG TPA: AAA family ATPase, partial [Puia sp.]|nr:AAA family ATPase [Puia sp.]
GSGARNTVRQLYAPEWNDISRNYPRATRSNLDRLVDIGPDDVNGKIVLLHGPPGTGKTTFLVTLGKAWSKWCDIDIVIDPEMLFGIPDYMITAFLRNTSTSIFDDDEWEEKPANKWRMIVLEDTDELISADAHAKSGQAMSRLLNLTDGMLGKGANLILALTTNEDLSKLHPAITRPGRCLMNIEMPKFDIREGREWLGDSASIVTDHTLAELYELQAGADNNSAKGTVKPGQYL